MISHFIIILFFTLSIQTSIRKVHIISGNHLDIGYTDFSVDVINKYFDYHFPQILKNIDDLSKHNINYVFTTHAWLIHLYLHCNATIIDRDVHCPSNKTIMVFKKAIMNGHITWHSLPMNTFTELQNEYILDANIKFVHALDKELGLPLKTVVSQRDVPGMTIGVLPIFVNNGIRAISVGVNILAAAPNVPKIFKWRSPLNKSMEIIALWNANGYGSINSNEVVVIDGYDEVLLFNWRGDNDGPGDSDECIERMKTVNKMFPNATIELSSFEIYIDGVIDGLKNKVFDFPIITEEIGDTWNYGLVSDPKKVQYIRQILRFIVLKRKNNQWLENDKAIENFMFHFLKTTEHTWGLNQDDYFNDHYNWDNKDLNEMVKSVRYQNMIDSWIEQREYLNIKSTNHSILKELHNELIELENLYNKTYDNLKYYVPISSQQQKCNGWDISFGPFGNVNNLSFNGQQIFSDISFSHQTFGIEDVNHYIESYGKCGHNCPAWFYQDYGKSGLEKNNVTTGIFKPKTLQVIKHKFECKYAIISKQYNTETFGPPEFVYMIIDLNKTLDVTLLLENKTKTRQPEAFWLSFIPTNYENWMVHKINTMVSPHNVVQNGTMHLHGTWDGVFGKNKNNTINIKPIDSALISFNYQIPYPTPFKKIIDIDSIHFPLWSNVWGTNFPLWYPFDENDKNMLFRFSINIDQKI